MMIKESISKLVERKNLTKEEAKTTMGEISFPDDYKGKWVILFSHPADFTPVCTTEFMTFASMQDEFRELKDEEIGFLRQKRTQSFFYSNCKL